MSSNSSNISKRRQELIAHIPRTCLYCDACNKPNPPLECRKCYTIHYCSSDCLRALATHECHDVETMRNAMIGIRASLDVSQAKNDTCGICLACPMDDPAVLPGCQHAFCRACLQLWHQMEKFKTEITCTTCRSVLLRDDNPLEKAKIFGARAKKVPQDRMSLCKRALDELDTCLAQDETNLQALFTQAEIFLIQSEPQSALNVLEKMLSIDQANRSKRQAVSEYLDQAEAARESGNTDEAERIMELAQGLAGKRGELIGTILQTLVDVFLLQAEAYEQLGEWFTAKEIYKQLLGLGSGVSTWILVAIVGAIVLLVTHVFFGNGPIVTMIKQASLATLLAAIMYGVVGRFFARSSKSKSKVLSYPPELREPSVPQQRQCYMSMIQCYYHLRDYDRAIRAGALALRMNRHFPGVHYYIAQSYQAQGKTAEALHTLQRALLYETPWDLENIGKQLKHLAKLLEELKSPK